MYAVWKIETPKTGNNIVARFITDVQNKTITEPITSILCKKRQFKLKTNEKEVDSLFLYFMTGKNGIVYVADDLGNCDRAFSMGGALGAFLFYEEKSSIIAITNTAILAIYNATDDMKVTQQLKTKINLSSSMQQVQSIKAVWVGKGIFATISNESQVRIWNVDNDDHVVLTHSANQKC